MPVRYLLDEHLSLDYRPALLRRNPALDILRIGDPGAPRFGTLDPDILLWCEEHEFCLVTSNREPMPAHLADHLAQGSHVPGIFALRRGAAMGPVIQDLILIAGASLEGEFRDRIVYVPLA